MIVAQLLVALTLQTTPQTFVQSFYDWYTRKGSNMDSVVAHRSSVLSPPLLAVLRKDRVEQAKNPGEITGLDFDPFVNSQDPCEHYVAGTPVASGQHYRVPVFGVCEGKKSTTPDVIVELEPKGDGWSFVNFWYPEIKTDLLTVLAQYAADRKKKP
ncbi:MAG TPA: hypothetical protein VK807_06075 [Gemmatimonadaceae bacterium]|jgi:hypothetical protein|nr:hypothetical protein [Gemmatimonadaceae bacterium]